MFLSYLRGNDPLKLLIRDESGKHRVPEFSNTPLEPGEHQFLQFMYCTVQFNVSNVLFDMKPNEKSF